LQELESETACRVSAVLQLRVHPDLVALRQQLLAQGGSDHDVCLTYITARGPWYDVSWKGSEQRSGGLITNIGIHFFDLLQWLFGAVQESEVHLREPRRAAGYFRLERARVRWLLSAEWTDVPDEARQKGRSTFRSITVDGREVEFSEGFADLHTRVYEETLAGRGFGIDDSRPAIELTHRLRQAPITSGELCHPLLSRLTR
jgi:UDP-N-acetyl-2-amino-2-deoxyglucuronate dehydrogenase